MITITEFISARLDDDERIARAAFGHPNDNGVWERDHDPFANATVFSDFIHIYPEGGHSPEQAEHIARRDPARALLEVKAWRHVVKCLAELEEDIIAEFGSILEPFRDERTLSNLGPIVAIWNTHPDYQAEWAP